MSGEGSASSGRLARLLRAGRFVVTSEVVPGRTADPAGVTAQALALIGAADAVNVTDHPGASARMSPVAGAGLVAAAGLEPIVQLTCRDRNRIALTGDLLGAWALGARAVLCLSGDPVRVGDHPDATAVDDLSVLDLVSLARRLRDEGRTLSGAEVASPPRFLVGVAEAPLAEGADLQRLEAKADAGAEFVQTQMVFDVEAFAAWADRARARGLLGRLSVLAGVGVPASAGALRTLAERLPGIVVPDAVLERLEAAGPDEQAGEAVRIAADLVRRLRRIEGIAGVHVMGLGRPEAVRRVVEAAGLAPRAAAPAGP